MHGGHGEPLALALGRLLTGQFVKRVCLPHAEFLGLELGGQTLGFGVSPGWGIAVGLCEWVWPRGASPEVLVSRLKGARIAAVETIPGEPILQLRLGDGGVLVWEALGRSANLFLLDAEERVLWAARRLKGPVRNGTLGEAWVPPPPKPGLSAELPPSFDAERFLREEGPRQLLESLVALGRREALATLSREERALRRGLQAVAADREEGDRWNEEATLGNLLLAAGDLNRRGLSAIDVTDWSIAPPAPRQIPLDPALSLKQNAEAIFKRARKGKARKKKTAERAADLEERLALLAPRRESLLQETDLAVLYPKSVPRTMGRSKPQLRRTLPPDVAAVPLPEGFAGFAGKSAAGNDWVSFRLGKGGDFWFHASDYPGCHVVVRNPSRAKQLPPEVERAAALYAARHSGAPPGNRLAVHLSQCKFLRRVPGAPGRVMLSHSRTVFVELPRNG